MDLAAIIIRSRQVYICHPNTRNCKRDTPHFWLYTDFKSFSLFRTSVATASSSWIDDYIDWLTLDECCKINTTTQAFCPSNGMNYAPHNRIKNKYSWIFSISATDGEACIKCPREFIANMTTKRPTPDTFDKYISFFLNDIPTDTCAKAGRPAYAQVLMSHPHHIAWAIKTLTEHVNWIFHFQ